MIEQRPDEIAEIEATQAALRESIAATKELSEDAELLLSRHRQAQEKVAARD